MFAYFGMLAAEFIEKFQLFGCKVKIGFCGGPVACIRHVSVNGRIGLVRGHGHAERIAEQVIRNQLLLVDYFFIVVIVHKVIVHRCDQLLSITFNLRNQVEI